MFIFNIRFRICLKGLKVNYINYLLWLVYLFIYIEVCVFIYILETIKIISIYSSTFKLLCYVCPFYMILLRCIAFILLVMGFYSMRLPPAAVVMQISHLWDQFMVLLSYLLFVSLNMQVMAEEYTQLCTNW